MTLQDTPRPRTLTERLIADVLSVDRLELYLAASELRVGRYDALTHLLSFDLEEVQRIAARLEIPWVVVRDRMDAARKHAGVQRGPESAGE